MQVSRLMMIGIMISTITFPAHAQGYTLGPGDQLMITVPLSGSLSDISRVTTGLPIILVGESIYSQQRVTVTPDGFISVIGLEEPLYVAGKDVAEAQMLVANEFNFRLFRGRVTISLEQSGSHAFFVSGEVSRPGRYILDRTTTLLEALTVAGGPTERAQLKKVLLLRDGKTQSYDLTTKKLLSAEIPTLHIDVSDMIIVPRRKTPDSMTVLLFLTAISVATGIYLAAE